eukprot:1561360-Lingulodinium_polyedra.AAC.1
MSAASRPLWCARHCAIECGTGLRCKCKRGHRTRPSGHRTLCCHPCSAVRTAGPGHTRVPPRAWPTPCG